MVNGTLGVKVFWLTHPHRILDEGRPEWSNIIWELVEDEEHNETCRVGILPKLT